MSVRAGRISNKMSNHTSAKPSEEHGTVKSYVIGYVLSMIFTLIPYSLVVNQTVTGVALFITILLFAVIQMIIQVTFFLHLGRGPKPNWNMYFYISTVAIVTMVVVGSVVIIDNLHSYMSPSDKVKKIANDEGIYQIGGKKTGACEKILNNHQIIIKNNTANPSLSVAKKCDTLTFTNEDDDVLEITFGPHPEHGVYAGEKELIVKKGRSKTITLSELGAYQFHDHLEPKTAGEFIVIE